MASIISAGTTDATSLNVSSDRTGILQLASNNAVTAVTIDASQNVGIGRTLPTARLHLSTASGSTALTLSTNNNDNGNATIYNDATYFGIASNFGTTGIKVRFALATPDNAMTVDSSGNLLVGRTTTAAGLGGDTPIVFANGAFCSYVGSYNAQYSSDRINFNNANYYVVNGSTVGVKLVSGSTSWTTQSDERTKTDLVPISNGLQKINTLRAVTGRYTKDEEGVSRAFLIAQDVKAVLPEAVDEDTDEEKTLGLRYTETIPLLVAAIKELKAINDTQAETINALTARIVAIESRGTV